MRLLILLLATTLAATGCTNTTGTTPPLTGREWRLVWIEAFPAMPSGVATPTIRFGTDGRMGGNTGCNSAGANYTAEGDRLTLDAVISTKRACINPDGNALERAYIGAVESTRRYRIMGNELELLDENGQVVARFAS